jgi:hypothetical protein
MSSRSTFFENIAIETNIDNLLQKWLDLRKKYTLGEVKRPPPCVSILRKRRKRKLCPTVLPARLVFDEKAIRMCGY